MIFLKREVRVYLISSLKIIDPLVLFSFWVANFSFPSKTGRRRDTKRERHEFAFFSQKTYRTKTPITKRKREESERVREKSSLLLCIYFQQLPVRRRRDIIT